MEMVNVKTTHQGKKQKTLSSKDVKLTYSVLPVIIKHQSFSNTLSLIVAAPDSCNKKVLFQDE